MTTTVTFDAARTQERAARGRKGMKAGALLSALVSGIAWLPFSSAAEAAPFQQYRNGACAASLVCTIDFPVLPAGRRLDITNASCYLRTSGGHQLYAMQLLVVQGTATQSAITLVPKFVDDVSAPFESVYAVNDSILAFANPGQRFRAYVQLKQGTFGQFACHISGQLQIVPVT